jgi:hypothetical protein
MKTRLTIALIVIPALLIGCSTTSPPAPLAQTALGALTWDLNPPVQQISAYRVYRVVGKSGVLQATLPAPPYRPSKKGSYYVTAVNSRAESAPSRSITL